jgi:CBS domain-containing protein
VRAVRVTDLLRSDPVTVTPSTPAAEAARRLHEATRDCLVVVDDGTPVGLLARRDFALDGGTATRSPSGCPVGDLLPTAHATVSTDSSVTRLCTELRAVNARHAVVVDGDGGLAGVVSLDDLLVALVRRHEAVASGAERRAD